MLHLGWLISNFGISDQSCGVKEQAKEVMIPTHIQMKKHFMLYLLKEAVHFSSVSAQIQVR